MTFPLAQGYTPLRFRRLYVGVKKQETKMAKTVVIIATLDTKGEEARYIKELIEKKGA